MARFRRTIVKKTMSSNWSEFKLRINTTASVEKAYAAVATPGGLEVVVLENGRG